MVRTVASAGIDDVKRLDAEIGVQETTWTSRLVPGLRCVRVAPGTMDRALAALRGSPLVRYADPECIRSICSQDMPYGIALVNAPTTWPGARGGGAVVADLDTGVDLAHPDLPVAGVSESFIVGETVQDGHGHGTHTAGTIAAQDNTIGVVGVAPAATLIVGKVLGNSGSGSDAAVAAGIEWAVQQHARVISMSLGSTDDDQGLHDTCDAALAAGVLIVAAAGNDNSNELFYPADYSSVLAVSAVDSALNRAGFSNFGPAISLAAPGVDVKSTFISGGATWAGAVHTAYPLSGSASGSVSAAVVACGLGDAPSAFPAVVSGNIAHIRRGGLTFQQKVQNALDAGAVGVVISNNVPGTFTGTLQQDFAIPVVGVSQADGDDLLAHDGEPVTVTTAGEHAYAALSGTSMACPHVSGVAALLFGAAPSATPAQVRTAMERTALDLGDAGRDDQFGYGLVRADAALQYLLAHACRADFNASGDATVQDIFDYLAAWFAGDPRADFNGAGGITVQDVFDFLAAWFAGC